MEKPKRKSIRKEVVKITAEGEKSRVHFTLHEKGFTEIEEQSFDPNPDLVKLGQIDVRNTHLKVYYFKNNDELIFIRIGEEFIPLNQFKWRELMSIVIKGAFLHGVLGKGLKTKSLRRVKELNERRNRLGKPK